MWPSRSPEVKLSQIALFSFRTGCDLRSDARALVGERTKKGPDTHVRPRNSPSRERFRPPSRRTFRFRVVLLGGLRPTGAPCSAQAETYDTGPVRSRGFAEEFSRSLRTNLRPRGTAP